MHMGTAVFTTKGDEKERKEEGKTEPSQRARHRVAVLTYVNTHLAGVAQDFGVGEDEVGDLAHGVLARRPVGAAARGVEVLRKHLQTERERGGGETGERGAKSVRDLCQ